MALSLGQTGTADSVDAEYFNWESSDRRFMIHMHLDAIDGLARDLIEGVPREVGGILLGQVGRGERPVVWIERYQRVETGQRQGTSFVLDDEDHAAFERAARSLSDNGELTVVGYYRTHLRPGFQLEDPDRELISRYFADKRDVLFADSDRLPELLAEALRRTDPVLTPFEALVTSLADVGTMLGAQVAPHAAQRREVIARSPELQERGRTKFAAVAHALRTELLHRGTESATAELLADVGVAVFRTGFDRWVDDPDGADLSVRLRETGAELADAVTQR